MPVGGDVGHAVGQRAARDVLELAARRVDGEAGRDLRLAARPDVEEPPIGAHRHRCRAARLLDAGDRHLLHERQVAALPVELEHVDLVALGIADVDEGGRPRGRGHHQPPEHSDRRQQRQERATRCSMHGSLRWDNPRPRSATAGSAGPPVRHLQAQVAARLAGEHGPRLNPDYAILPRRRVVPLPSRRSPAFCLRPAPHEGARLRMASSRGRGERAVAVGGDRRHGGPW